MLATAIAMSQFTRASLGVVAPDLMAETGLAPESYAWVAGAFFFGIAGAQIPTGVLLDRFGARATMAGLQVLAAVATMAFAFADRPAGLGAARLVTGAGFAAALMGGLVVGARWFPRERFAQVAAGLIATSHAVGLLLAATPMAALSAAFGWRAAFVVAGALTLLGAALLWLGVRDAPEGHPWHARAPETLAGVLRGYGEVWRLPDVKLIVLMAMAGYPIVITIVGVWGGPYLADVHGLDGIARGNVLSVMIAGGVAGLMIYGPLDRRLNTRKWLVIAGALAGSAVLGALALIARPPLWLVTALFALYGLVGAYYIVNIALGRAIFPEHLVGRGVTTVNLGTFGGVGLVQLLSGVLMSALGAGATGPAPEGAYRALFGALALWGLAIAALYARVRDIPPSAERGH